MRKIKFRAWDKITKQILKVVEIKYNLVGIQKVVLCKYIEEIDDYEFYERKPDDFILMQYTGLIDKNCKEIYEGDIVRFYLSDDTNYISPIKDIREDYNIIQKCGQKCWEVIGNIYENRNLLKESNKCKYKN